MMKSTLVGIAALMLMSCGLAMDNEDRLARGQQAYDQGDYRAAIIDAKEVLRSEPDNVRGRLLLGRASVAENDGSAAEKELRRAVELGAPYDEIVVPLGRAMLLQRKFQQVIDEIDADDAQSPSDRVALKLIRGDAFMGLEHHGVARELFSDVLRADPENSTAMLGIAAAYRADRNLELARATLDEILQKFPDEVRARIMAGELDFVEGRYAEAGDHAAMAVNLAAEQDNEGALLHATTLLAESNLATGQVESARESVQKIVAMAPNSLQALFMSSRIAYLDSDWKTAQQNLQRILQAVPDNYAAKSLLGAVHLRSGNLGQAEMYLSTVVVAEPENDDARRMLAEARLLMEKFQEAEETLQPLVAARQADTSILTLAARAKLIQGDSDAAIDYLQRILEQDPGNIDRKFDLAIALLHAGRVSEFQEVLDDIDPGNNAIDEFRRDLLEALSVQSRSGSDEALLAAQELVEDWPRNADAHRFLGAVQLSREDLVSARQSFARSLEIQPGNVAAQRSLAIIDEREGLLDAAKTRYESILAVQSDATWAMFGLARLAARGEDLESAHDWLQKIRNIDSAAVSPRATLAALLLDRREFDEAESVIGEALTVNADIAELHNLLGRARSGQRDHAGASEAFRRALELEPSNADYRVSLAQSQRLAGNAAAAERTLTNDGTVNLDHIPSAAVYVSIKVEDGDFDEAMRVAKALQERFPDNPAPFAIEAEILVKQGNLEGASEAYDRALSLDVTRNHALRAHSIRRQLGREDRRAPLEAYLAERPLDGAARLVYAESLQRDDLLSDAIREYETVAEQLPDNGIVLNNLAWTYYLAGDARAAEVATKAAEIMPDNPTVADTLGWILVEAGRVDEGIEVLQRAVEQSSGRAEFRYHYAVALSRTGREQEARRILQDIVGGDQEFASREEAERLLADL